MQKTLLLVFIHGFKGDHKTFKNFPDDLRALLSHTLPNIKVVSIQYPTYETRGDLNECVVRFKEWLQNQVIDLEVANGTPSPTVDPSVHVVLCGHSMGGIVAAEALLSIVRDDPIPASARSNDAPANSTNANTTTAPTPSSAAPADFPRLFFPYIRAILAFDTPYLGVSPGVLAHGAEQQYNHASTAYKAFDSASTFFGWNSAAAAGTAGAAAAGSTAANSSGRGNPGARGGGGGGGWNRWGRYAMVGGAAAAAVAGMAGAAYLNWDQINAGLTWAGSHLEFVGCLARGAELKQRLEALVGLTGSHQLGFADFYSALGAKAARQTRYAGSVLGGDRTFCIVPRSGSGSSSRGSVAEARSPTPSGAGSPGQSADLDGVEQQMEDGKQVRDYAKDTTKSKGTWVRCVNDFVTDEISAHRSMFAPDSNPDYHAMVPRARDQIYEWIDMAWYESAGDGKERMQDEQAPTAH